MARTTYEVRREASGHWSAYVNGVRLAGPYTTKITAERSVKILRRGR